MEEGLFSQPLAHHEGDAVATPMGVGWMPSACQPVGKSLKESIHAFALVDYMQCRGGNGKLEVSHQVRVAGIHQLVTPRDQSAPPGTHKPLRDVRSKKCQARNSGY